MTKTQTNIKCPKSNCDGKIEYQLIGVRSDNITFEVSCNKCDFKKVMTYHELGHILEANKINEV